MLLNVPFLDDSEGSLGLHVFTLHGPGKEDTGYISFSSVLSP